MSPPLAMTIDERAAVASVAVAGELDMATAPQLVSEVGRFARGRTVRVDLSGITFMDCAGLHGIEELSGEHGPHTGAVRIVNASSSVRLVADLAGRPDLVAR